MGKGIALQFRETFPENYRQYNAACRRSEVQPGKMFITENAGFTPHWIINFPTKRDWRGKSKIEDIESGLTDLINAIRERNIRSIAVPPLGCGNGGLRWDDVRPRIEAAFQQIPEVTVLLYAPETAPESFQRRTATRRPAMTPFNAALLRLLHNYARSNYRLSLLEVQKLMYFLFATGEPVVSKLNFVKGLYGPYSESINYALRDMNGHFLSGYTGDRSPDTELVILPNMEREADLELEPHQATRDRIAKVASLIEGFDTPYGLELLATIHFLAMLDSSVAENVNSAIRAVHGWSVRKGAFPATHIKIAWEQLQEQGWFASLRSHNSEGNA